MLVGDPAKPGLYVVLNKLQAQHNSKLQILINDF